MPQFDHVQATFTGGELSPRMRGRVDSELYRRALEATGNWQPLAHGSLRLRGGTQFSQVLPGADARTRIFPFRMGTGQDYLVQLLERTLRLYDASGSTPIAQPLVGLEMMQNPTFSIPGGLGWTGRGDNATEGAVVFDYGAPGHTLIEPIQPRAANRVILYQAFTLPVACSLDLAVHVLAKAQPEDEVCIRISSALPGLYGEVGDGFDWRGTPAAASDVNLNVPSLSAGVWYLSLAVTNPNGSDWGYLEVTSVSAKATGLLTNYDIPTPWTLAQGADVRYAAEPGQDRMFFTHPSSAPFYIKRNADGSWLFGNMVFQEQPAAWTTGCYPSVCEVYQSRLWLAATPTERNRVWASRVGDCFDFRSATGSPVAVGGPNQQLASDSIDEKLSTKGAIRWLRGRQAMLVGTDLGVGSITAQGGAVTPLDFQFKVESSFGAAPIQADDVGDQVLYVSADTRKVRAVDFAFERAAWVAHDLTFNAEHITSGAAPHGIRAIHFAPDPDPTIVVLLQDGTLACCTYDRAGLSGAQWYDRGQPTVAWWRALTTGLIHAAAVLNGPLGSLVYLVVQRAGGFFLERMPMSELYPGWACLDAAVSAPVPFNAPGYVVTGLTHLEGQTVRVILDGALEDDQVVRGGAITLARAVPSEGRVPGAPAPTVTVGLAYPLPTARTLPPEGGNPKGTSQRAKRRWVKCVLRLNDSALPLVNGVRAAPDRSPSTALDTAEPRATGDFMVELTGWDNHGQLTLTQDLPFRTEILAVFGSVQLNEV